MTSTIEDYTYAENADMYGRTNGAAVRMYHAQFPDRRMPDHRIVQRLHRQLRETRSFHFTKHDTIRRREIPNPSLGESTLNVMADRPKYKSSCLTRKGKSSDRS
ncbi:hypothetical protein TNCV_4970221 [Trichonephila clavipes]|uniref:DUF4817 domain-containing protein n=1 Tax=Trichonephila clavipes TaxID=2585209 RepID=A0A8X6VJP9_TRICX|nr:hypothetical protein TNCV_4970221 [Trichonephila clavipes]